MSALPDEPFIHPDAWWSTSTIARWMDYSVKRVEAKIVSDPTFPPPERFWDGAHPRWKAGKVMAWFDARVSAPSRMQTLGNKSSGYSNPDDRLRGQDPESEAA